MLLRMFEKFTIILPSAYVRKNNVLTVYKLEIQIRNIKFKNIKAILEIEVFNS